MQETVDEMAVAGSIPDVTCHLFSEEGWQTSPVSLPCEMSLTIHVNGQELVTMLCTPSKLNCLVTGFLYSSGIICGLEDIAAMRICEEEPIADVRLNREYTPPPRRTLTSGCGSGVSFTADEQKVVSDLVVAPQELLSLMKHLNQHQRLFRKCGGVHCSALCDRHRILVAAEDIGRHNTLDKILGECLLRRLPTQGRILLTTGRISSEMLLKAARMQAPVVVSRGSPTERAVALGRELGITVVGYARAGHLSVFSGEERLRAPVANVSRQG